MTTNLNNASAIIPLAQKMWDIMETEENIAGTFTIALEVRAPLHIGDMNVFWRVRFTAGTSLNYESYTVQGQELDECVREILLRVRRDLAKRPLAISRDMRDDVAQDGVPL